MSQASSSTDTILWQQLLAGEATAFSKLYEVHASTLSTYGLKLSHNQEIVNDAIQDVFIHLWQKKEQLPEVNNVRAYLLKSLRNRILRILETRNLNGNGLQPHQALQDSHEKYLISEEIAEEKLLSLHNNLKSIPTRQKEVINLRYFQELKHEEIAEILDINYQSVSNLLYKGINSLKKQFRLPKR